MKTFEKRKYLIDNQVPFLEPVSPGIMNGHRRGFIYVVGDKRKGIPKTYGGETKAGPGSFAEIVDRFFSPDTKFGRVTGTGCWVVLPVPDDFDKSLKYVQGEPCEELVDQSYDSRFSQFAVCARVKVNEERCKMHQNGRDKQAENDRKRREKWARQDEAAERRRATRTRAEEAIDKLTPALVEMGVLKPNLTASGDGVVMPPELAEQVAQFLGYLDEYYRAGMTP